MNRTKPRISKRMKMRMSQKKTTKKKTTKNRTELEAIDVAWNELSNPEIFVVWRVIDKEGIITIFYSNDSQRKLFPNSETWYKSSSDSKWNIVKSNGQCMTDQDMKKPINIATNTIPRQIQKS
eukprot:TRINITY_DN1382_c0_g1_i2.p1 TRINITY_DN1382_c0_g1~~TRINITY_DN1382_c0_g1_i2.p1  ORF type:complete len:123 (-),score=8.93 TRINITY_DN1382_c0_g1_i2:554-922(-)